MYGADDDKNYIDIVHYEKNEIAKTRQTSASNFSS